MNKFLLLLAMSVFLSACFNDLNVTPLDEDEVTSAVVYDNPAAYKQVLAKLYAGLSVSGQQGPAGSPDISGIDEGFSTYLRQYWKAQELTTDEAVIAWNDGNIHDYEEQDWDANNEFVTAMYNRIFYQISLTNEFLRETTAAKLDEREVDAATRTDIGFFRSEARFLRALSYYHALDMFRKVPFVTEQDAVGSFFPEQGSANEIFTFVESELLAIESTMVEAMGNEYGRADQAAAWMLLSKLYLNAEVYVGENRYSDVVTYTQKVIDAGFVLDPEYDNLFLADNNTAAGIIFPVLFDGVNTKTWGGMTFIVHAAVGGSMNPTEFGLDGGWGGIRTTKALVEKFPSTAGGSTVVSPNPGNTTYPKITLAGSFQGWTPDSDSTVMASVNSDSTYEGYFYFADAATAIKFTDGNGWDNNWGDDGADGTLEPGGTDISVADAGFYRVRADLANLTYSVEATTWGLIGSATPNGWDSDTDMTFDATEGAWVIQTDLIAGEVKFRANDLWDLDYGDSGADAILEQGGDNIVIPANGNYIIKLYLDAPDHTYSIDLASFDARSMFYTDGQNLEINDVSQFTDGYAITKFRNVTSDGTIGSDLTFPDTDFPMFRLADAHLMYAEAVLRGGSGGDVATAVSYVNEVRARAYGGQSGNVTEAELDLAFILDERAREFYWECHRRTDLVRFGQFSNGSYVWPLKGGINEGAAVSETFDVFPIPASDLGANPNLTQNPGY
ncbi:MAG: RagB/SusD family nutrient uptake outer membrane protein [Bacteroidia bacterium]